MDGYIDTEEIYFIKLKVNYAELQLIKGLVQNSPNSEPQEIKVLKQKLFEILTPAAAEKG